MPNLSSTAGLVALPAQLIKPWRLSLITTSRAGGAGDIVTAPFGPFSVDPGQVAGLSGGLFQSLINSLLDLETARVGMLGAVLHTSYRENIADKGVDAALYDAPETGWIPAGDSAWQFKAGDLSPAECASEFEGATRAHEIVGNGGKYRLVVGKALEDHAIADREAKLREKAVDLGFDGADDNFRVFEGNMLSRWVESHPQLAVSALLRGSGQVAIPFDSWKQSNRHQSDWVPSAERDELRSTVLDFLAGAGPAELRIEGESGRGKTRGVLEALRGSPYEPLVLYVGDAEAFNVAHVDYLTRQGRTAVLVLDECPRTRHNIFAEQLQVGSQIKIISIGYRDMREMQRTPLLLSPLPDDVIEAILQGSRPALWPEARRVVVANCGGNIHWALRVAEMVLKDPSINVGNLIDAETLQLLVGDLLSGDGDFLALSALALFTRFGFEREARIELEQISRGLGISLDDLTAACHKLERLGLMTPQGRYRSVTPQPLAVYLARQAWQSLAAQIVTDLIPILDDALTEQLFLRAADLGSEGPSADALDRLVGDYGPFQSLAAIADGRNSRLLTQLAIISPTKTARHLSRLIHDASVEELRELKAIRRNLVWTLEKLVWHTNTFEVSADMLLALTQAENETWSNNATGTWLNLFGAMLPATAAGPPVRMSYLQRTAESPDPAVRLLAVGGARRAVDARGATVMVSGELQGGVVVEPRGTPTSDVELWDYMRAGLILLQTSTTDQDASVREASEAALLDALHPMLELDHIRDTLFDALSGLSSEGLRKVRTQIQHLYALFARVESPEFVQATNSVSDVSGRRAGLDLLTARLPVASPLEELATLAYANRWEWDEDELAQAIVRVASRLPAAEASIALLALLEASDTPKAAFELGGALFAISPGQKTLAALANLADQSEVAGLVGYLIAAHSAGDEDAFDGFLDGPVGIELKQNTRLAVTVRGPQSAAGWNRLIEILKVLPVRLGAPRVFGWHVGVSEERIAAILDIWLANIDAQEDLNFAVDAVAMMLYDRTALSPDVEARVAALVELRWRYPDLGQQEWNWTQLARRQLRGDVNQLLLRLLQQVDADHVRLWDGREERSLFEEAIVAAGPESLVFVLDLLLTASWRVRMDVRGWLADLYPVDAVAEWVGRDLARARLVASLISPKGEHPSDVLRFILNTFGSDDEVVSSLYGEFMTGGWVGPESHHLSEQIAQLQSWVDSATEQSGVKQWAMTVIESLKKRRSAVSEEEAERGF